MLLGYYHRTLRPESSSCTFSRQIVADPSHFLEANLCSAGMCKARPACELVLPVFEERWIAGPGLSPGFQSWLCNQLVLGWEKASLPPLLEAKLCFPGAAESAF